ncbi:hypothetical protein ACQ4M4_20125 [Leptolyngbya sp. AN02str]|uniref:hypothetical protein n=1 Tax=Leptolyngbya sp. AN02str TaxID=3423363 RepID=UPI003D311B04
MVFTHMLGHVFEEMRGGLGRELEADGCDRTLLGSLSLQPTDVGVSDRLQERKALGDRTHGTTKLRMTERPDCRTDLHTIGKKPVMQNEQHGTTDRQQSIARP